MIMQEDTIAIEPSGYSQSVASRALNLPELQRLSSLAESDSSVPLGKPFTTVSTNKEEIQQLLPHSSSFALFRIYYRKNATIVKLFALKS